jgi:hypothetical protein
MGWILKGWLVQSSLDYTSVPVTFIPQIMKVRRTYKAAAPLIQQNNLLSAEQIEERRESA